MDQGGALDNRWHGLEGEGAGLALLLRSVVDYAIYMLDSDGYVRSWNTGGEQIKGYRADEIVGQHFSRFYTPEDVARGLPEQGLREAREAGRFSAEGWRVRKDGARFRASVVIDPVHEGGRLVGYAKVTRDITERYEAEQALEQAREALLESRKMESIGKLTLGLAHDFNNLITIVVNSLELLESRHGADTRTQALVATAMQACDRGALLTRQLLAFGRGQPLAPEPSDVDALLEHSMDLYRRACQAPTRVQFVPARGLPPAWVDHAQFEAAILNLVVNSRDAMPSGGTIRISSALADRVDPTAPERVSRPYVCVTVEDDGEGIDHALQGRVFEPFFTTKEIGKGSGLGLSQVFGFAAQSGGFAELESEPGRGTRVSLCLPLSGGRA